MTDQALTVIAPRGVAKSFDAAAMVDAWREDMRGRVLAGELAQATATTYARGMRAFLDWTEAQGVDRIGPQAVRRWKAAMLGDGLTPAGVNVRYAGVRAFFGWAVAGQGLAYDPTAGVKGPGAASASPTSAIP